MCVVFYISVCKCIQCVFCICMVCTCTFMWCMLLYMCIYADVMVSTHAHGTVVINLGIEFTDCFTHFCA